MLQTVILHALTIEHECSSNCLGSTLWNIKLHLQVLGIRCWPLR